MQITKEYLAEARAKFTENRRLLIEKVAELRAAATKAEADATATSGAIQVVDLLFAKLAEIEPPAPTEPT